MNVYLTIMVTVLVITQIIRVTQNAIQLHGINKKIEKKIEWIENQDVSERDFEVQRAVFYLLHKKLTKEMDEE